MTGLREMQEGELRGLRAALLNEEELCRKGEPGTRTWPQIRDAKAEIDAEIRARGLEPRTGLKKRVAQPSESSGQKMTIKLDPIGSRLGQMSRKELLDFIQQANDELGKKGE